MPCHPKSPPPNHMTPLWKSLTVNMICHDDPRRFPWQWATDKMDLMHWRFLAVNITGPWWADVGREAVGKGVPKKIKNKFLLVWDVHMFFTVFLKHLKPGHECFFFKPARTFVRQFSKLGQIILWWETPLKCGLALCLPHIYSAVRQLFFEIERE